MSDKTKLCVDCAHYRPTYGLCTSPANGISPVTGENKPMFATAARAYGDVCGIRGKNFTPIENEQPARRWWQWFG